METFREMGMIGCMLIMIVFGVIVYFLQKYLGRKRHKKCGEKGFHTGTSGIEYAQYECRKCETTFWVKHFEKAGD